MSRRPTDWSPLAGSDPVPGDPDEVERAAKSLADMAEEITRQTANLRRLATAEGWDAEAGRTFAESAGELSGELGKAHGRYATAAGALKGYAPELRHAQSVADAALTDAKQAEATMQANRPPDYPPAGSPTPVEVNAERQRQYAYDEGIDALHAARRKLQDATDHRDEHSGRAARAIRESIDDDGLKDSWWDKFTNWVSEHADLLRAIARIAELVATVLSVIAMVISFIPVLNFLAPVLLGLAALASAVALVCTIVLALAGEASWTDVGLSLLSVAAVGVAGKVISRGVRRLAKGTRSPPFPHPKGISKQKQAGHVKGTPQYNNRVKQGKKTSHFDDAEQADRLTREAWEKGTPTRPDGKVREFDFGRRVGTGPNGGEQTKVKTHMDDNGMIHGHPTGPESP
ncbi:MAG: hypothetical protein M3332_10355 [Actinomycetota bacterium]|nr:hypothetical protein [Actinomycetota bacterium]